MEIGMKRFVVFFSVLLLLGTAIQSCRKDATSPDQPEPSLGFDPDNDDAVLGKVAGPAGCKGKIGNFIWIDLDCDGVQDCHNTPNPEPGLQNVVVELKDPATGQVIATTTTDSMGRYMFRNLCEGNYLVEIMVPDGYQLSMTGATDSTKDSNPNPSLVMLGRDPNNRTIDFGLNTCGGGEGCTPGYWKQDQHFDSWPAPYTPDMLFSDVFEDAFPGMTLVEVASTDAGGLDALGRHVVAALLNSASDGVSYDLTTDEVIDMFNDVYPSTEEDYEALKDIYAGYNEQDCPLN